MFVCLILVFHEEAIFSVNPWNFYSFSESSGPSGIWYSSYCLAFGQHLNPGFYKGRILL